jgi:pimeloyl-ACP methyl ester carboxylesterase
MTHFVLVHGAWHGSWCWARLRRLLAAQGHEVFTPTLTGLGERSHLLSRDIGLETHVADVTNLLAWEDLRDIVLVGHSYGGIVVRHAADRMADRIRSLVYLDAFVTENGQSLLDTLPDGGAADREQAARDGDGWKVKPIPAAVFRVNDADAAWVDRQCTPQPLATFATPARLTGACDGIAEIGYILATGFQGPFGPFAAAAERRGWWRRDIACGHDVMLDAPEALAAVLLERA